MWDSGPAEEVETNDEFGATAGGGGATYDSGSLASLGVSLAGCPAVLNIGHWTTMAGVVLNHTAGEQNFTYTTDTCGGRDCPAERHPGDSKGRYFIEFCPQVLDDWGEADADRRKEDEEAKAHAAWMAAQAQARASRSAPSSSLTCCSPPSWTRLPLRSRRSPLRALRVRAS